MHSTIGGSIVAQGIHGKDINPGPQTILKKYYSKLIKKYNTIIKKFV